MKNRAVHFVVIWITTLLLGYADAVEIPPAKDGQALIVFYRERSAKGGAVQFRLNQGEEKIGTLPSGTTLFRFVEPGKYTFWSKVISSDSVTIDAVAGETYYIKGTVKIGAVVGRPKLALVPADRAKSAIKKLK